MYLWKDLIPPPAPRPGKLCLICPWKASAGGHTPGRSVRPQGGVGHLGDSLSSSWAEDAEMSVLSQQAACARPVLAVFTLTPAL